MDQYLYTLSYRIRIPVVLTYLGQLLFVVSLFSLVTLLVAILTEQYDAALRYSLVIALLGGLGFFTRNLRQVTDIQPNEALVITSLAFLVVPALMAWPMMTAGISYGDALFESISAVTTTGLSTISTLEDKPMVFLFSRVWMQWVGGLGIVILTLAILSRPGMATRRLAATEVDVEDLIGSTRAYARQVAVVYIVLSILGMLLILATGVRPFDALLHTLASISTGGFSHYNNSLESFTFVQQAAIMLVSTMGGVSLILYYKGFKKNPAGFLRDFEFRSFLLFCVLSATTLTISGILLDDLTTAESFARMPLMAFSAQSTTGFAVDNIGALSPGSKLVMIFSMAMGGMIGSTAGGIKVFRVLVFLRILHLMLARTSMPRRAVATPRLHATELGEEETRSAILIMLLFILIAAASWLPFLVMDYDSMDSLFDVVSALGTVGISSGVTGPHLSPLLKAVLCGNMLLGRLEFIALLVLLYPATWAGRRMK